MERNQLVVDIAKDLNMEAREVYLALKKLNYIVNVNQRWGLTQEGVDNFTFANFPRMCAEIRLALEESNEKEFEAKLLERQRETRQIKCNSCGRLRHPTEFAPHQETCTPCIRRNYARRG